MSKSKIIALIKPNEEGSVTLSKEQYNNLSKAYKKLKSILNAMPSSLEDYCSSTQEYLNIYRWSSQFDGQDFDPSEWDEED